MSNNIERILIITSENFDFPNGAFKHIDELDDDDIAECWPTNDDQQIRQGVQEFATLFWTGESSGYNYETFLTQVLTKFTGKAEILVLWDNDDPTGIRVDNGEVTKCKVSYVFTPEEE